MARATDPTRVATVPRETFLGSWWKYETGQHVSFLGPTGSGKTTLAYQLLKVTATPQRPGVVLVMKPRDSTVEKFSKSSGFRIVKSWPPPVSVFAPRKPPGFVLWPSHTFDLHTDREHHYRTFARALNQLYAKGDNIVFADEVYSLVNELPPPDRTHPAIDDLLVRTWSKGRSMSSGLWGATQRPAWVPQWMYSEVQHIFLARTPDERAQKRFDEISGIDGSLVRRVVGRLPRFHWLYIRQEDQTMVVIGP